MFNKTQKDRFGLSETTYDPDKLYKIQVAAQLFVGQYVLDAFDHERE